MPGDEETIAQENSGFNVKLKWVIPHKLDNMTFVGKDIFAVAHDIYIIFFNLKTNAELVYVANNEKVGDGVDVIAGHRSNIFAFAEKAQSPRILLLTYPKFKILAELKDRDVNRYKGVCMMESDLVAGFSGFPHYLLAVWNWRTQQRLISVPTGVGKRTQIYMASRSHMLVCECWGEGLAVWEVAQCYRRCFVLRRGEPACGAQAEAPLAAVAWAADGQLYAVDHHAHLYAVASDGIGMVTQLEWSPECGGSNPPHICAYGNGLLLYGPDNHIRLLKKAENQWKVSATVQPHGAVARLVSNAAGDAAVAWTRDGLVCAIAGDDDLDITPVAYKQRKVMKIQMIAPENQYVATINDSGVVCLYEISSGNLMAMKHVQGSEVSFEASPTQPVIAILGSNGPNYGLALYRVDSGHGKAQTGPGLAESRPGLALSRPGLVAPGPGLAHSGPSPVQPGPGLALSRPGLVPPVPGLAHSGPSPAQPGPGLAPSRPGLAHSKPGLVYPGPDLVRTERVALTHQIVSRVVWSPTGRELLAAAMSAGHIFIYKVSVNHKLTLVRYAELGRGLADCFLMRVGDHVRAFSLVLFSDKYAIGERIICMNAVSGKDNKLTGKMAGPYRRLLALAAPDHMLAIPHLARTYHVFRLTADKGVTVSVKMGPVIDCGHEVKQFDGFTGARALLTFGYDGHVVLRQPDSSDRYDLKLSVSHRYESGIRQAVIDSQTSCLAHLGFNRTCAVASLCGEANDHPRPFVDMDLFENNDITIIEDDDKTYLDLQEEKRVHEEAMDCRSEREEVVRGFRALQTRVVALLEENLRETPLHQLSLAEFNLHLGYRKERSKQAEREREEIRVQTEALISAQDAVCAWIKRRCWDCMLTPTVKLYAIFTHYQVENYAVLPSQRNNWPELNQAEALRAIEMENDGDLFRPWEEPAILASGDHLPTVEKSVQSIVSGGGDRGVSEVSGDAHVLAGSSAHRCITPSPFKVPQTQVYSFLHMNLMCHIIKLTVQNMRLWFNKQFDELMALKRREVALVRDRNARLRFIVEELNKLSDLRSSFHHLVIEIRDPEWRQEEQPEKLVKVDPDECSVEPYISPSQVVVVPPEPAPKDDFRERALVDMMDGVLEKLWHEEIKKPIVMPLCMLEKDPEHFNEDDLRLVFEYEAKVAFRNDERDKYRKMLHAEYAKLAHVLNEGVGNFNQKVKEMWLTKLKVDSIIGQENLNLMRLRRTNLDRVEMAEKLEHMRETIATNEQVLENLSSQLQQIQEQNSECSASYEQLSVKDKHLDKSFKTHFADLSPIIVDQCYKFFKKRPKWQPRASLTPAVLYDMAAAVLACARPRLMHPDCADFFKGLEQLDLPSNMPAVMDDGLWATMCRLRRAKIDNELRVRAVCQELSYVESAVSVWARALAARRTLAANTRDNILEHRRDVEHAARNRTIQLVLPAGQVEILTTGHIEDFEDATLILKEDIDKINDLILKVGGIKVRMMGAQTQFRAGILQQEWTHAQTAMKLRHMTHELHAYHRLKIPKELQLYLKNKELGYTEEQELVRLEKEMEATKTAVNRALEQQIHAVQELEMKSATLESEAQRLETLIAALNVQVSDKRLNEDPLQPIRRRRLFKKRMETLVSRGRLVREVQRNHSTVVLLQTELELLRLRTYPTLASFRTFL